LVNLAGDRRDVLGRERELRVLSQALDDVRAGRGRLALISGSAGIGKTTLIEAFAEQVAAAGALVLVGRSHDLAETPPFGPWRDLFQHAPAHPDRPDLTADRIADVSTLTNQILRYLTDLSDRQSVLLVFEDAQWSDPASIDLLRTLAREAGQLPVLFAMTWRDDEFAGTQRLAELLPAFARELHLVRVSVRPLPRETVAALVRSRYDLSPGDARRLDAYLDVHAQGNPLFVNELLHALEDDERLSRTGSGVVVGDLSDVVISPVVQQIIGRKFSQFSAESQRLLSIAATIGETVPLDLWARVAGADEGELLDVVEAAVSALLMVELADGSAVRFTHTLIREVLYRSSLSARRRGWHRAIAEALLERANPASDVVARHLREAGDARAVDWLIRAGDRAQAAGADLAATQRFEEALQLLADGEQHVQLRCELLLRLGRLHRRTDRGVIYLEQATQLASQSRDATLLAIMLFRLGWVQCYTGKRRQGLLTQEQGVVALDALPAAAHARVELVDWASATFAARHGSLALRLAEVGRFDEAATHAAAALADPSADPWTSHDARVAQAVIARSMGRPDDALRLDAEMYALDRRTDDHDAAIWLVANDLLWSCLSYRSDDRSWLEYLEREIGRREPQPGEVFATLPLGLMQLPLLYLRGEWQAARAVVAAAQQTEFATHVFTQVIPLVLGPLAVAQGDHETVRALVQDAFPNGASIEPGDSRFPTSVALQRLAATVLLDTGDLGQARQWLEANDRWLAWSGAVLGVAENHLLWARYELATGHLTAAVTRAQRALESATTPRQPLVLIAVHRLLADLDISAGRPDAATQQLERALRLADAIGTPYERALTLLSLADLRVSTGDLAGATAPLQDATSILMALDARPALIQARELAARSADRTRYPMGLTEREVEVLRLVAAGQSNRDIGLALGITTRTAERHVSNVYLKIDAGGRAEATAFAIRHGLV
jgi:DNA-binding CsgD family transcriptional regulator